MSRTRRTSRPRRWLTAASLVAAAGALLWALPGDRGVVSDCRAIDGDTLNCDGERIRLLGIDTPERPGSCRAGRDCVEGDYAAARDSLEAALTDGMRIERVGEDRYDRTLALVEGVRGDLSCLQLRAGHAVYVARWDDGRRVFRRCPLETLG